MQRIRSLLCCALAAGTIALPAHTKADTQNSMTAASCAQYQKAQQQLAQVYSQVRKMHAADTVFIARLEAAEQAWANFRDAEIKAVYPSQDASEYGSSQPMCQCSLLTQLTQQRILQLQAWLKPSEGDVCAGSRTK